MIEYENLQKLNSSFINEFKLKFDEVSNSGWYILGKQVIEFEKNFSNFLQIKHCIGVGNGLDALSLGLRQFDYPPNSEIIVPSNTYIATILSIIQNNLIPVLVEPNLDTYNIDPKKIEEKINTRTRSIMVVHLYGKCCDMESIMKLANKYNLSIIEDCAQSHGAQFKGKNSGTFGEIGAFSFYPTKNLGALGDAGCIVTNNDLIYDKIKILRNYGSNIKYHNEVIGYNSRLDELQAAFLLVKLKYLRNINNHKIKLASLYMEGLKSDFIKPIVHQDYKDVYHIFNIRHKKRDLLKDHLFKQGIITEIHYPIAPHSQIALKNIIKDDFPISSEIHKTTLSLPISYFHTENDICKVIDAANSF
jgi:dTDP-4-amino-4,6-dideoxygalactose transaminase